MQASRQQRKRCSTCPTNAQKHGMQQCSLARSSPNLRPAPVTTMKRRSAARCGGVHLHHEIARICGRRILRSKASLRGNNPQTPIHEPSSSTFSELAIAGLVAMWQHMRAHAPHQTSRPLLSIPESESYSKSPVKMVWRLSDGLCRTRTEIPLLMNSEQGQPAESSSCLTKKMSRCCLPCSTGCA